MENIQLDFRIDDKYKISVDTYRTSVYVSVEDVEHPLFTYHQEIVTKPGFISRLLGDTLEARIDEAINRCKKYVEKRKRDYKEMRDVEDYLIRKYR